MRLVEGLGEYSELNVNEMVAAKKLGGGMGGPKFGADRLDRKAWGSAQDLRD